jgi:hypothetical protein
MVKSLIFAFCTLFVLVSAVSAQSASYITNYSQFQTWLPIIMLAIVVSILITSIYYVIGVLLNNHRVKANAITEMEQAVGTAIVTILIIGIFALMGSGQLSLVSLLSPQSVSTVCSQLSSTRLTFLNSKYTFTANGASVPSTANAICSGVNTLLHRPRGADLVTPRIDYGLFYSYVIIDNLTNQAANNLNAFYVFTGWIGFLSAFKSYSSICWPATCAIPGVEAAASIAYSYQPYAGYNMILSMIKSEQLEAGLTFYAMIMQLLVITLFLYAWPYMLAAGIILRSSFLTRRVGGLLMAMSLAAVLIFPILYGMEYSANTLTVTTSTTSTSTTSTSTTSVTTTSTSTRSTTSTSTKSTTSSSSSTTMTTTSTSTTSFIECLGGGASSESGCYATRQTQCDPNNCDCIGAGHPEGGYCDSLTGWAVSDPARCSGGTPWYIYCSSPNCISGTYVQFNSNCQLWYGMGTSNKYSKFECASGQLVGSQPPNAPTCNSGPASDSGCLPAGCTPAGWLGSP